MFEDLVPTDAEQKLIAAAARGADADFRTGDKRQDDPATGDGWGKERTIRAEIIYALATRSRKDWPVHPKGIQLWGARITGALDFEGATIEVPIRLWQCRFEKNLILRDARTRTISLDGTHLPGIQGDRAIIEGGLFMRKGFTARGEVRFLGAVIDGNFDCHSGKFAKGEDKDDKYALAADGVTVKGDVFLYTGFTAIGEVRFPGADIGGDFYCGGGTFANSGAKALLLQGVDIKGGFFWRGLTKKPIGQINLDQAKVGQLADDAASWPDEGMLILDGFKYGALAGDKTTPKDAKARLQWLQLQPKNDFRPQPYEQLVKVFREMGHEADAREIAIAKQDALRKSGQLSRAGRFWNWLLGALIGHGYRPWKVLAYLGALWVVGAVLFAAADGSAIMRPANPRVVLDECYRIPTKGCEARGWVAAEAGWPPAFRIPADYPPFNPVIYTLDMLIPVVPLGQEGRWYPSTARPGGVLIQCIQWLLIALGWALSSIGIVGMTGLVKKD